jgi:predicted small metal-binding protein
MAVSPTIDCADLGYLCSWRWRADSRADLVVHLTEHLHARHGVEIVTETLAEFLDGFVGADDDTDGGM